jgi:hypothetical protein
LSIDETHIPVGEQVPDEQSVFTQHGDPLLEGSHKNKPGTISLQRPDAHCKLFVHEIKLNDLQAPLIQHVFEILHDVVQIVGHCEIEL